MSRQQIIVMQCDVCKSDDNVKTVEVAPGFEMELCELDRNTWEDALKPFVEKARKVGRGNVRTIQSARSYKASPVAQKDDRKTLREWAWAQGVQIPGHGRIAVEVLAAFNSRDVEALRKYAKAKGLRVETGPVKSEVPAASFSAPDYIETREEIKSAAAAAGKASVAKKAPAKKTPPAKKAAVPA